GDPHSPLRFAECSDADLAAGGVTERRCASSHINRSGGDPRGGGNRADASVADRDARAPRWAGTSLFMVPPPLGPRRRVRFARTTAVIDASVAVKLVLAEEFSDRARSLLVRSL